MNWQRLLLTGGVLAVLGSTVVDLHLVTDSAMDPRIRQHPVWPLSDVCLVDKLTPAFAALHLQRGEVVQLRCGPEHALPCTGLHALMGC